MNSDISPWQYAKRYLPFSPEASESLVHERLVAARAHLWNGPGASGVTEISDSGNLHVWLAGGDLTTLLDMLPSVEAFAKAMDCPQIELSGREGWQKVLKSHGFRPAGDALVKDII